jgi:hypothetical protein
MSYTGNVIGHHLETLGLLGNTAGVSGTDFGIWCFIKQHEAQAELGNRQRELNDAVSQLRHLKKFPAEFKQYPAAV